MGRKKGWGGEGKGREGRGGEGQERKVVGREGEGKGCACRNITVWLARQEGGFVMGGVLYPNDTHLTSSATSRHTEQLIDGE